MKVSANSKVLRWARATSNLSLDDVASRMGRPRQVIEAWESGQDSPTYAQLETLAYNVYKRPLAVFFFPEPPEEEGLKESFRTLPDVEFGKIPPRVVHLIRQARSMQIGLGELCDGRNPSNTRILGRADVLESSDPVRVAQDVRRFLNVTLDEQACWADDGEAAERWRRAIEDAGVFVFKDAFRQDEVSGFCLYDREFPVILVNNSMPLTRQMFTLFHELAHLMLQTSGIDWTDDLLSSLTGRNRRLEVLCNEFAAEVLAPTADFMAHLRKGRHDDHSVSVMAARYSVSREVILRRLLDIGLVTEDYYRRKAKEWIAEARRSRRGTSGGNYYATKISYLGRTYLNIAFAQYYRNRLSIHELSGYLGVKVDHIPALEQAFSK
ncbi:MAG: XRE family transcriptional regulator [Bacillota bacterium]|nr:XRE family transcriptional regulator [Bacillota bacterium]